MIALPVGVVTLGLPVVTGVAQVIYAWAFTFGIIGLFRRYVTEENKTIRYLSDSAYWLYLVHLPLIVLAQAWVRDWDLSAFVKFTFVCTIVTVILLILGYFAYSDMLPVSDSPRSQRYRSDQDRIGGAVKDKSWFDKLWSDKETSP